MATNRTFQFYGIGFGSTPVTVTARVNNTEIFSGEIPTIDRPIDPYPYPMPEATGKTVLFRLVDSALLNTDFAGSVPMTVEVTGGYGAIFSKINSNYYRGNVTQTPTAGTVNNFGISYTGVPTNSEGSKDSRSSVIIDGVAQTTQRPPDGTWWWLVPTNTTMSYNWNISVGQVGNTLGNFSSYTAPV